MEKLETQLTQCIQRLESSDTEQVPEIISVITELLVLKCFYRMLDGMYQEVAERG